MTMREEPALRRWATEVARSAALFESRWTMAALRRVDPDLCDRLRDQRELFDRASITGSSADIERHGSAMCRGYAAVAKRLDETGEPDDAYVLGHDAASGLTIAIGDRRAAAERVHEIHGSKVIWMSPDEVCGLVASLEAFKALSAVKRIFPGSELVERYADQPAQSDAG